MQAVIIIMIHIGLILREFAYNGLYELVPTSLRSLMVHMDRISMGDQRGVSTIRF